jgi:hypothetical protein
MEDEDQRTDGETDMSARFYHPPSLTVLTMGIDDVAVVRLALADFQSRLTRRMKRETTKDEKALVMKGLGCTQLLLGKVPRSRLEGNFRKDLQAVLRVSKLELGAAPTTESPADERDGCAGEAGATTT